jgi:hypothetical protein
VCRLVPHALLGLLVLFQPGAFASKTYFALAVAGMGYIQISNARQASMLLHSATAKAHAH